MLPIPTFQKGIKMFLPLLSIRALVLGHLCICLLFICLLHHILPSFCLTWWYSLLIYASPCTSDWILHTQFPVYGLRLLNVDSGYLPWCLVAFPDYIKKPMNYFGKLIFPSSRRQIKLYSWSLAHLCFNFLSWELWCNQLFLLLFNIFTMSKEKTNQVLSVQIWLES